VPFSSDLPALRSQLKQALLEERHAEVRLKQTEEAVERGDALIAARQHGLDGFRDLDDAVVGHAVDVLRGGSRPLSSELPADLQRRVAARETAVAGLGLAERAALVLRADHAAAVERQVAAAQAVETAVMAILVAHAEGLSLEFQRLRDRCESLRLLLQGLDQMGSPVSLGPVTLAILSNDPTTGVQRRETAAWRTAMQALRENADQEIDNIV
jgi:hypothetical protein